MRVEFTDEAWADYLDWFAQDGATLARINALIEDARRQPFAGLGKPEPLKGPLTGCWSRRITREHRLVYRVAGKAGEDQRIIVLMCRYHYG
ncbi:Txe/YoeB family addiction module toxin [Roseomonas sp. PWR1]|uniref:Putative mRNA interferase YoeB n=1 Tax=Roseomonas nitratireducens TaxID=2820810 RepID=A0ABS4B016_9PROT|nr:Txe/YoeB family addiction module toxin [Neoroseomonas nitratireducens]MBP0466897.1 Txe/YoeB family addiction module toxin [Neoroseomonas nitratireducens]